MSEFIGESTVIVKADTRAFLFQVKRAIAEAEKLEAVVPVRASTAGFRADLIEKVKRSQKGVVVNVLVKPDMTGFRTRLIEAVKASSKGVVATVGVVPSGVATGAAARAAAAQPVTPPPTAARPAASVAGNALADQRTAAAITAINKATEAGIDARRRISGALSVEEKRSAKLARELTALRTAQEALRRAIISTDEALIQQARDLVATADAAVANTRAQQERAALRTPEGRAAALEKQAAEELAIRKKLEQEITKAHGEALRENARLDKAAQAELGRAQTAAIAENKRRDAQARQARQDQLGPLQTAAIAENKQRDLIARQLALSVNKQAEAEAKLANIARGGIAIEERSAEIRNAQAAGLAGVTSAEKALATARSLGVQVLIETSAKELERAVAARASSAATLSDIRQLAAAEKFLSQSIATSIKVEQQVIGAKNEEDAVNRRLRLSKTALAQVNDAEAAALQIVNKELRESILLRVAERKAITSTAATELAGSARRVAANKSVRESVLANTLSLLGLRGSALAANAAFLGTSAAIIALAKSVGLASKLASQLNVFQATAGATADQMERVSATAEQLGRDITLPGVGATDAAQALTELSKAGLSVQDSIDGARGVLQLATAAAIDNSQATDLVASALNAFGLAGDQAVRVADDLANAANDSQGSIVDIGIALQQSSAVARQAGLSLEQTVSALTILARAGLRSSDAGTSLRTALLRLINPSKRAQEQINKLGLSVRTSTGAINLGVFDEFARKTRNFTKAQRDQALAIIFGQDAIRAAAILSRTGARGLDAQVASIEKQGTASKLAAARMKGLTGSAENLKNQLAALGIEVGQLATGPLVVLTNSLAEAAGAFADVLGVASKIGDIKIPKVEIGGTDSNEILKKGIKTAITLGSVPLTAVKTVNFLEKLSKSLSDVDKESSSARERVGDFIKGLASTQALFGGTSKEADKLVLGVVNTAAAFATTAEGIDTVKQKFAEFSPAIKTALQDGVIDTAERATIATTALGRAFLSFIDLPTNVRKNIEITTTGPDGKPLTTGISQKLVGDIEDASAAAKKAASPFGPEMAQIFARAEGLMSNAARHATTATGDALEEGVKTVFFRAIAVARQQAGALEDEMNRALIAGAGPATQNKILQKQFANAQTRIDAANARLTEIKPGDKSKAAKKARTTAKAERSAALAEQARITGEIESNNQQIVADKKEAADRITEANNKADQDLLNALSGGRTRFTRAISRAQATPGVDDNIRTLQAFRRRLLDEVKQVRSGVKDAKTKAAQLKVLSDELFQNSQDIQAARKARNDAIAQALQDKGTALQQLGELTGNFALALKGFDLQIAAAKQLLVKAKQDAAAQKKATAAVTEAGTAAAGTTKAAADAQKRQFTVGKPKGLEQAGNINLLNRPRVRTPGKTGFTSTVRSITVGIEKDGKKLFALIPTVVNKAVVSNKEAIKHFEQTGKNLGIFTTEKFANAYSATLHNQQAGLTKSVSKSTSDLVNTALATGTKDIVSDATATQAELNFRQKMQNKLDFIKQTRQDLLQSAEGLAEARFNTNPSARNKSALLQILDLQIANANREAKAAKTLPEKYAAMTEAINLADKKKQILADALNKDQQQGTTVLDLLKQGVDTFNKSAGNLVFADQPFAGPNAFNADIAQFLKFRKKLPDLTDIGGGGGPFGFGAGGAPRGSFSFARGGFQFQQKSDPIVNDLIAALNNLAKITQEASGNTSTAAGAPAKVPVVKGSPWAGKPWFNAAHWARSAQES